MKNALARSMILFAMAVPALAIASPSSSPAPEPPAPGALVILAYNSGFTSQPYDERITLRRGGDVILTRHQSRSAAQNTQETIAHLSVQRVQALISAVEKIRAEDLTDQQEGQPICTDAPTQEIKIIKRNGEATTISRQAGCHAYKMPASPEARAIEAALEGLAALGRLDN